MMMMLGLLRLLLPAPIFPHFCSQRLFILKLRVGGTKKDLTQEGIVASLVPSKKRILSRGIRCLKIKVQTIPKALLVAFRTSYGMLASIAAPLTSLKDHRRKGEKLTLSPSGTLAATTDSLGRILLLDAQALVVVRLWKGYRDASCLFMERLVNRDTAASSAYREYVKSDYCLCLAIHAPRKGIVEVWQMRTGPRLLTVQCPKGSKVLQPAYRFGSSTVSSSSYVPWEVFFLNGDSGQLSVLNRSPK